MSNLLLLKRLLLQGKQKELFLNLIESQNCEVYLFVVKDMGIIEILNNGFLGR